MYFLFLFYINIYLVHDKAGFWPTLKSWQIAADPESEKLLKGTHARDFHSAFFIFFTSFNSRQG